MQDNEAEGWEELRRLRTGDEFRDYASRRFGTPLSAGFATDPTRFIKTSETRGFFYYLETSHLLRNLTYHGYLRKQVAIAQGKPAPLTFEQLKR